MKWIYYVLKLFLGTLVALLLVYLGYRSWQSWCDPISVLMRNTAFPTLLQESSYASEDEFEKRIYTDIVLDSRGVGLVNCTVSLPVNIPEEGLPCILLISGLDTGKKSLNYLNDQRGFAIISYEYPQVIRNIKSYRGLFRLKAIRQNVFNVPSQLLSVVRWAQTQPWCEKKPISIPGFSFGAIFIPATYHFSQKSGIKLGPSVIGYGGAGLFDLFYANLPGPIWLKTPLAYLANFLFRPIEPAVHAPFLKNRFLIINGLYDKLVPFRSAERLQNIIPEPKTVENLETEHMYPENQALINLLLEKTKNFLINS
ncbi:MAG: hypothetical protein COT84_06050 [Chlamydiae bacterium CG10_big_fil_rev_8_21_14_0_10_35_9]|nr:MAG: hypothetical protein COT84_06050 [Chlamydiae bacterium CG10_big_fil_rev_8_21_14_0_10_35_9]